MILHIDMDAFFASIEQAINPRLRGKPLIVGSRGSKMHTVVCAASYEAKRLGIGSGMSSVDAFKICPVLEFVPADQGKYIWTSQQILQLLKSYGFEIEYASIDEFRIDIKTHKNPLELAESIRAHINTSFNITASVGIACNSLLAKLASKLNKPNGTCILSAENLVPVLSKTPVEKLCGVGKATAETMHGLKIITCLDLYQKNAEYLKNAFGKNGLNLFLSLHSEESFDAAQPPEKQKSIGHSYTLPRATENPGFIKAWLRLLSEMVAARLRQDNLVSGTIHLWLNGPEIGNLSIQKSFQQATDDGQEIYQRTLKIASQRAPKRLKIRALGVTASGLKINEYLPLFIEQKRREALLKTLDSINNRFGEHTIFPAVITVTRKMA